MKGDPSKIRSYFLFQWPVLAVVSVTGIFYNIGLTLGPWFEGEMAQYLCEIIAGSRQGSTMLPLAAMYLASIVLVQGMRFLKRLYVRKFANNIGKVMKMTLYRNILAGDSARCEGETTGSVMSKAISDVEACTEGMRKFTTEIFDTGIALIAYCVMLLCYDWRLTLIALLFPPVGYILAEKMKGIVTRCAAAAKESAGRLNGAALDRVSNAMTYRVYGLENAQNQGFEAYLDDYEKKTVRSHIWEAAMPPVYQIIAMIGAVFILWLGGRNVLGMGWTAWDIAAFTTYLSCFTKLAVKSSKAAKLFNSVQKASVSWKRIQPYLTRLPEQDAQQVIPAETLCVENLHVAYPGHGTVLRGVSFTAAPGQIIGITGEIASGKSALGKALLCEEKPDGTVEYGGEALDTRIRDLRQGVAAYMGHRAELFSDTVENNITLGNPGDVWPVLRAVRMDEEVSEMPDGIQTRIGNGGMRLSGGQQARIALARTLYHRRPLMILDDPFASVDRRTEQEILANLRKLDGDCTVLLISHRLSCFPLLDKVLWIEDGTVTESSHGELMAACPGYRRLWQLQTEGGADDEAK